MKNKREVFLIKAVDEDQFKNLINKMLLDDWMPHWETFKVLEGDNLFRFYILMEKKIEDNK